MPAGRAKNSALWAVFHIIYRSIHTYSHCPHLPDAFQNNACFNDYPLCATLKINSLTRFHTLAFWLNHKLVSVFSPKYLQTDPY